MFFEKYKDTFLNDKVYFPSNNSDKYAPYIQSFMILTILVQPIQRPALKTKVDKQGIEWPNFQQ